METINHKVVLDDYVEVTLKIPKVLTALELKGLMIKANKLLNLSEVNLTKRKYTKKEDSNNYRRGFWNAQKKKELLKMVQGENKKVDAFKKFAEKYNKGHKTVAFQYFQLQKAGITRPGDVRE